MTLFLELVISLLAAFGLVCLGWLAFGRLVLPVGGEETSVRAEVTAAGEGGGLEQAVAALLWLRRTGLWRGTVTIRDGGMDAGGRAIARRLAKHPGVEYPAAPETERREDVDHGRTQPQSCGGHGGGHSLSQ